MNAEIEKVLNKLSPKEQEVLLKSVTLHYEGKGKSRKDKKQIVSFMGSDVKTEKTRQTAITNKTVDKIIDEFTIEGNHKLDIARYSNGTYSLREWIPKNGEYRKSGLTGEPIPNKKVEIPTNAEALEELIEVLKKLSKE